MDPAYLSTVVSDDLPVLTAHLPQGSLRGLDVVHLQCHIGTDTISLARAGGRMTGVDFSLSSLAAARRWQPRVGSPPRPGPTSRGSNRTCSTPAWPEDERDLVPCTFMLVARKP